MNMPLSREASAQAFERWWTERYGGLPVEMLDARETARLAWERQRQSAAHVLNEIVRVLGGK